MNNEILTKEQLAEYFQVKPLTIMNWVKKGMPCSDLESGSPRFLKQDCIDWKFKKGFYSDAQIKMPKKINPDEDLSFVCAGLLCNAETVECVTCAFYSSENFNEFIKQCGL